MYFCRICCFVILLFSAKGYSQSPVISQLHQGKWIKIGVNQSGIYSIQKSFLENNGISVAGISPKKIKVHGFGGVPLPEKNGIPYPEDLPEQKVWVYDGGTANQFDPGDYILFYAQGPNEKSYNASEQMIEWSTNPYSDTSYYFIRIGSDTDNQSPPLRNSETGSPTSSYSHYVESFLIEKDSLNITHSGRNWYWKSFEFAQKYEVSTSIPGCCYNSSAKVKIDLITRCVNCNSEQRVILNGTDIGAVPIFPSSDYYNADMGLLAHGVFSAATAPEMRFTFNKPASVTNVWLDKININIERDLKLYNNQTLFRHPGTLQAGIIQFQIANAQNALVWDVSRPDSIQTQQHTNGLFSIQGGKLNEFVVFNPYASFPSPTFVKQVPNQNIHGLQAADMIIIAPEIFMPAAQRLAQHRFQRDAITSILLTPEQIFNEFSSGTQDPTAIRNMMQMFYQRSLNGDSMVKYLLLFGDGSYDYKEYLDRVPDNTDNLAANKNKNYVLTWETKNSLSRTGGSYPSDDYFVMLQPNNIVGTTPQMEGLNVFGMLSSGVGRILAYDEASADHMVNKIIHYDDNASCKRDWRNKVLLVADDMDSQWEGTFLTGSEGIAQLMQQNFPVYNIDKIYADAYPQVISNGQRYPEASKQIFTQLSNGVLLFNYIGHGGEIGLSSERLLSIDDVNKWKNKDRLPVFLTATCTFTRFDLAKSESAGELMARRPDGGAIALFSTTRAISLVDGFNAAFYNAAFTPKSNGKMPTLGEVFQRAKNISTDFTSTPISLFGDPSQKMAYPENRVFTSGIYDENNNPIDTLKATQVVVIKGYIADSDGFLMSDFDGIVYPTIFDKASNYVTRQNDAGAIEYNFNIQKNILFRGSAEVRNGQFEFTFKVPKDINYTVGNGKISYYASNDFTDANGYDTVLIGSSVNNCLETDGPGIAILLNNSPIDGQIVSSNPELTIVFEDESGINSSGLGIGHDIKVKLKGPENQEYNLNEYYSTYQSTFTKGELNYPILNLPEGSYELLVSAWDNCNNPSENSIRFVVDSSRMVISDFLAYPNPSDGIVHFAFNHNLPETESRALLQIYDAKGSLIHSISEKIMNSHYKNTQFSWSGTGPGGKPIAPGVYFCRLTLVSATGKVAYSSAKIIRTN